MLPVPLAQASSWNYESARLSAAIAAREAAASGVHWTFAPMIDISRDARWGRIMESAGEDTYLTSVMTKAWIEGYQGDDLADTQTIAACAKHFAAYGFGEAGREYNTVDISNHLLYNVVLPPFKVASDAKVATFMNAFNDFNGIPATANSFLQRDILKGAWGFEGFMVSDWASIAELISHGLAPDAAAAAELALNAGSDMDMESRVYEREAANLVTAGKVSIETVDDAVRRILRVKHLLGLFDDPYRYSDIEREKKEVMSKENLEGARKIAQKTMVLLKNEGGLLPLKTSVKSIAVIGQLANSKDIPLGSWRAQAVTNSAVSLVEGIQNSVGNNSKVIFSQGYTLTEGRRSFGNPLNFADDRGEGFADAIALAKASEVVILALGEDCFQSGEGRSQTDIGLKGKQMELFNELLKANENIVVVLMNGRPLAIPELAKNAPAILETWFAGSEAGNAIADVLFGRYNPSGKLPVSFPYHVGQEPLYYNSKNTGRPISHYVGSDLVFKSHYNDAPNDALFPFGHGLSYSKFTYSNLSTSTEKGKVMVSVEIMNDSKVDGMETVQLYIRDVFASATQPVKRLVAFKQVDIAAGKKTKISFTLGEEELGFFKSDGTFIAEDGEFHIMAGGNSRQLLKETVMVSF